MWRLALVVVGVVVLAFAGFVGYRAAQFTAAPPPAPAAIPDLALYSLDAEAAAHRLGEAIRFRTVSLSGGRQDDPSAFKNFQTWLAASYPAFHAAASLEIINGLSLLFTWEGSDPAQPPILLLAHQDVVPTPEDTLAAWDSDPFSGEVRAGSVWGRGAVDNKGALIAILEAAELLAAAGRRPTRTIIFAFGHDEELGGARGAQVMAGRLAERGVHAWFALDEGSFAVESHPLTGRSAALIGVSEKGEGTLRVTALGAPGHSSIPPAETAVSNLAEAIRRIHGMDMDGGLEGGPAYDMMRALAPDIDLGTRVALSNEWLFGPLLRARTADDRVASALMRTTIAPTMVSGGVRPNVLPGEAVARINLRIHPRDRVSSLLMRARAAVADIEGVSVDWEGDPLEASPVSRTDTSGYALIAALSQGILPESRVAPGLVIARTDARHYSGVAENIYRYQPILLAPQDWEAIHGVNERISIENFERMIRFYAGLMEAGAMQ